MLTTIIPKSRYLPAVLLLPLCTLYASAEVSLETIFQVQRAEVSLLDNSSYTLTIEGEHRAEEGNEQSRFVHSVESIDGTTLNQSEVYHSATRIHLEDPTTPEGSVELMRIPTTTAIRVLRTPAYALVWADVTRPQLQMYYKDDWAPAPMRRRLENHLSVFLPAAPSSVAFGVSTSNETLEIYCANSTSRLAGTSESITWEIVSDSEESTDLLMIIGCINGSPYLRLKLDPALGYRVVESEADLMDTSFAKETWTKTYQQVDGVWFPHVLTHVRRQDTGEVRDRVTWNYSNVTIFEAQETSPDAWLAKMGLPERALVLRVNPGDTDDQPTHYELIDGELLPVENLNTLVADLNLTR